jgi:hypothetical protein
MKNTFYNIILFLITTCAAISSLHATIPFTWIKGLYAVTKPEFNYLSPINGLVWYEQGIVENMYRYGDDNDATIKLVKELFYLQRDNISFVPTIRADKPASFFTPIIIGKIMAVIESYRVQPKYDDKELITTLKSLMNNAINQAQKIKDAQAEMLQITDERKEQLQRQNTLQTKINNINKQSKKKAGELQAELLTKNKQAVAVIGKKIKEAKGNAALIESFKTQAQDIHATIRTLEEQSKQTIIITPEQEAELNSLDIELKKLQQASAGSKDQFDKIKTNVKRLGELPGAIDQLAVLIAHSIRESAPEAKFYVSYATEQVLLALLWAKSNPRENANPKQDITDFLVQLKEYINAENLALWLQEDLYNKQNYEQFMKGLDSLPVENVGAFIIDNYEQEISSIFYFRILKTTLPPIFSGTTVHYIHTDGKIYSFSDCGETSVRNFFDIILYNRERGMLDISYLIGLVKEVVSIQEGILLRPSDKLIEFYQKHTILTDLTAIQLYDEWTGVVENLPDVHYRRPEDSEAPFYEIDTGLSNVLMVLNNLLFAHNPAFGALSKKDKLDLICSKLSRDHFILTWEVENQSPEFVNDHDFLTLIFKIKKEDGSSFGWRFSEDHFVIYAEIQLDDPRAEKITQSIGNQLKDAPMLNVINYNILAGNIKLSQFISLQPIIQNNTLLAPVMFNFIFLQKLDDANKRVDLIQDLLGNLKPTSPNHQTVVAILIKMINSLPNDDYYNNLVALFIIKNTTDSLFSLAGEKIKIIKNTDFINNLIELILNKKITNGPLFNAIIEKIQELTDQNTILKVIDEILSNKVFTGPLFDWAVEKIKNLKNISTSETTRIIILTLKNKITGPLFDWTMEKIKELQDEDTIIQLIIKIIDNKITGQPLDWAKEKISTMKNQLDRKYLGNLLKEFESEHSASTKT